LKVTVIGASGQLGSDLVRGLSQRGEVQPLSHSDVEVLDRDSLFAQLSEFNPDWVINTAAFHRLDSCEQEPEVAYSINETGALNVAEIAMSIGAKTVYISTDYVFDGTKPLKETYSENDAPRPLSVYGKSKYLGELATTGVDENNLVARISSVFGRAGSSGKGGNFVESILGKINSGESPQVIADNFMSPTYSKSAATLIQQLAFEGAKGIFHLNNSGSVSWFTLASEAANMLGYKDACLPIASPEGPTSLRPVNSSMNNSKVADLYSVDNWETALRAYLIEKGHL
jgi:dTDP-4-dehydrorhamnose reductase